MVTGNMNLKAMIGIIGKELSNKITNKVNEASFS